MQLASRPRRRLPLELELYVGRQTELFAAAYSIRIATKKYS